MRAAVEYGRGNGQPPPEIELANWCGEHHLPDAGAILDQDWMTMYRMRTLDNVARLCGHVLTLQGKDIHKLSEHQRQVIRWLMDEGVF